MWTIHCVKNDLKISPECGIELNKHGQELYNIGEDEIFAAGGQYLLNSDLQEYMDTIPDTQEILCRFKTVGIIAFADFEGDNSGEIWGYYFDGLGEMVKLKGWIGLEDEEGNLYND